jgi:hypothetical protein
MRRIGVKRLFTLNAPLRVFSKIISKNSGAIQNFEKLVNTCIQNGSVREAKPIRNITWLHANTPPPLILNTPQA